MNRAAATTGLDIVVEPARVEASLWRRLRFESELLCREQLFNRYRDLARAIARRQARSRPDRGVEIGDFEQFAYEGLLQAIDRYDPLRGAPFAAFARRRIAGSIADGAARMNEIDAQYGYRRRVEQERVRSLGAGESDGNALDQLSAMAAGLAIGLMLEGTGLIGGADRTDHRPNAYDSLAWRELQSILVRAVGDLPEREAVIIRQHYENGLSFTRIAQLIGVTKGRVSQLHRAAVERLRARIAADG
ncbi:sigma-70 family RNA polymerase sigma factor [Sphingomonas gilva]|nr:sigma-70 family RNA polymerase sigma factor [Sphingomonas gilva]